MGTKMQGCYLDKVCVLVRRIDIGGGGWRTEGGMTVIVKVGMLEP